MTTAGPSASAATVAGPLMFGSRGNGVATVQSALNKATLPSPGLTEDSNFGMRTDAAVRAFQQRNGLKTDGIVGRLTAQALGLQFIQQPTSPPQRGAIGTPQALLLSVLAKELKQISKSVDQTFDNGYDERPEVYDRARKYLKSFTLQTIFFLSSVPAAGVSPGFVANQTSLALLMMVGGFGAVAGQVARGGGDASEIKGIQIELNARTGRVVDIVRKTLEGKIDGGVGAGAKLLRSLLSDLAN
jgi:hypothetical protein